MRHSFSGSGLDDRTGRQEGIGILPQSTEPRGMVPRGSGRSPDGPQCETAVGTLLSLVLLFPIW